MAEEKDVNILMPLVTLVWKFKFKEPGLALVGTQSAHLAYAMSLPRRTEDQATVLCITSITSCTPRPSPTTMHA